MAIIPSTDINLATHIRDVLNTAGGSVTNNTVTFFQERAKINKWSKYKPVIKSGVNVNKTDPNWYKANDGLCGLSVGLSSAGDSSLTNLVNAYKSGTWIYKPPTGGEASPYRLGDFAGYDTDAVPFISSKLAKGKEFTVNLMETKALTLSVYYNSSSTSLQITDFNQAGAGLQDAHLGAVLYNGDPMTSNYATRISTVISDVPVTQRGTVTFNFDGNDIGTSRYIMFFLASPTVSNNMCIPYDDNNYFIFKVNVKQVFFIEITPLKMGNITSGYYDMSYYASNQFPSNNGYADVIFYLTIKNTTSYKTITVGGDSSTDYALRTKFDSLYTTALARCDSTGNALTDNVTIKPGETFTGYYKAPRMFLEFVNSWAASTSSLRGMVSIEAYNKKDGGTSAWQPVSSSYGVYVKR